MSWKPASLWVRGVMEHPSLIKPFKSSAMTYAVLLYFGSYLGYHTVEALYYGRKPEPVASDFKKYDRTTKKYVE